MSIDWTEIYQKYAGKWVALADDEKTILASDSKLERVLALSTKKGNNNPTVHRVPDEVITFVGHGLRI